MEQVTVKNEVIVVSPDTLREIVREEIQKALAGTTQVQEQNDMPEYLTQGEAVSLLRITRPTIHRWTKAGKLKDVVKIGRTVRYNRAELLRLKNSGDEN